MIRLGTAILVWFGLMFASLQTEQLNLGHDFCGPWGCGPPTEAILGIHLFWIAFVFPPVIYFAFAIAMPWRTIGLMMVGSAILGMIGFGIYDYLGTNGSFYDAGFVWQRYLLSLASLADVPLVQVMLAGIFLTFVGNKCPCCDSSKKTDQSFQNETVETLAPVSTD